MYFRILSEGLWTFRFKLFLLSCEVFVYNALPTDEYELATDVVMPQITVNIQRQDFYQVIENNGVVIEIRADKGVFPSKATAKVKAIEDKKVLENVSDAIADYKAKEAQSGKTRKSIPNYNEKIVAFDITIHDETGKEIQPNNEKGEVKVSFSELSEKKNADIQMFCIDDNKDLRKSPLHACAPKIEIDNNTHSSYNKIRSTKGQQTTKIH